MSVHIKFILIGIAFLASWTGVAGAIGNLLYVEVPVEDPKAIVVLSGSAEYEKRASAAALLWKDNHEQEIILTNDGQRAGWDKVQQRNPYFVEMMIRTLQSEGVPIERVRVVPGTVTGTYNEARTAITYLNKRGIQSVNLVTSGFHTRRSIFAFKRAGLQTGADIRFGISVPEKDLDWAQQSLWWLNSQGWRNVPSEVVKLAYYRWTY